MTAALLLTFEVDIPGGWHKLPLDPEETASAVAQLAASLVDDPDARERLVYALAAVAAVAQAPRRHGRQHWAYVPDPSTGRVEALLSLGDMPGGRGDYENYLALASVDLDVAETPQPGTAAELINRTVAERRIAVGRVVSIHDFVIQPTAGGVPDPAVERAIVALFPDRASRAVECSIVTQNLAQFEDVTGYLVDIVATFEETKATAS